MVHLTLDMVRIPRPCPADWERMDGDDRVRHCGVCRKSVYNLSEMTRAEAEALLSERGGDLCGRLYRRTDGMVMTADCPENAAGRRRFRFGLVAGALSVILSAVGLVRLRAQLFPDPPARIMVMGDICIGPPAVVPLPVAPQPREQDAPLVGGDASSGS